MQYLQQCEYQASEHRADSMFLNHHSASMPHRWRIFTPLTQKTFPMKYLFSRWIALAALATSLAACGGGGGSGSEGGSSNGSNSGSGGSSGSPTALPGNGGNAILQNSQALANQSVITHDEAGNFIVDGSYFPYRRDDVPARIRVSIFGDSLMLGVGTTVNPLHRIQQVRPEWEVRPHVAGGVSTTNAMTGYDENTEFLSAKYMPFGAQKPFMQIMDEEKDIVDVVVIQLGFNDAFRNDPHFKQNFVAMIQKVYAGGRIPVITGLVKSTYEVPLWHEYNRFMREYACGKNINSSGWDINTYNNPQWIGRDEIHLTQYVSDIFTSSLIAVIENTYADQQRMRRFGLSMYQEYQCQPELYTWMDKPPVYIPGAYNPPK